jgi:hypothetical protein
MPLTASPRRLLAMTAALVAASFVFVITYAATQHDPVPHGLRVAFVGPAPAQARLQAGLDRSIPGAVKLLARTDEREARDAVLRRSAYAAYVPGSRSDRLLTASAAGLPAAQALEHAFGAMAAATGRRLAVDDVAPLPKHDSRGASVSALQFGLLLPGFAFGVLLFVFAGATPLRRRLLLVAAFAVLASLAGALVMDPLLGALTGHFLALLLLGALFAAASVLAVFGLESVFSYGGIALSALLLILVANSTSGGAMNQEFLPGGFRHVGQLLPSGALVRALRDSVYFDGQNTLQPILVLAAWAAGGLLLVAARPTLAGIRRARRRVAA